MRYILTLLLVGFLCGMSPIYNEHDTPAKIDAEIVQIYDQAQPEQFRVVNTTPVLTEMKDNEVILMSTGTTVRLLIRNGQEIYAILGSCVTVRR